MNMEANIPKLHYYRCQLADGEMGYRLDMHKLAEEHKSPLVPTVLKEDETEACAETLGKAGIILVLESYRDDAGVLVEPDEELLEQELYEDY